MTDTKAVEIIQLYDDEERKQANLRSVWQDVSDLQSPVDDQIITKRSMGQREEDLYDETAKFDCQDMISGLSAAMIPAGQEFFGLQARNDALNNVDVVRRYLAYLTEKTHEEIFRSNFLLQLNEALRTLVLFGPCAMFSEFDLFSMGLNYKTAAIGSYQILENNHANVDTILVKMPLTARQAYQQFVIERQIPEARLGEKLLKAYQDEKKANDIFYFVHCIRPRKGRNTRFKDNQNMPYESIFVNCEDKTIVDEGGYDEFPYGVARWLWSARMKYGTGQGMMVHKTVKALQRMQKDLIESGNKWNNPPLEVLESFEGKVDKRPNAINRVMNIGSIRAIDEGVRGNFPITKDMIEFTQERVHKAYFRDIFVQISDLTGDRRTTVEINARLNEGLQRLSLPVSRLYAELFNSVISRSVLLLIRNGIIEPPPLELQGQGFGIEYKGRLALALKNQQAEGFMRFATFVGQIAPLFPDALDSINLQQALPDMAESFGVKIEHLASEQEIMAKQQARIQQQQATQMMQAMQAAAPAYKAGKDAPEDGSPAAALMEKMGG